MKLSAVVRMIAATETRFFSSSAKASRSSRACASIFCCATSSRRSRVSSEGACCGGSLAIRGLLDGRAHRRDRDGPTRGPIVDNGLAQLCELLVVLLPPPLSLPFAQPAHLRPH